MNRIFIIIAIASGLINSKAAQSQSIDTALTETFTAFDTAKAYPQMSLACNQFKLIAKQNPDNWLCNFYASWSIAILSFSEPKKDNKDPMLDEADAFFKKIENMDSTNDEVAVLGALLAQARLSVAPMSRHSQYGAIANGYYEIVKKLNLNNPRMYHLQANSLYYTPKLFGGGADKALPLYEKAETLFANDSKDIHKPHWGKTFNEKMLKDCKEKAGK
jgi:hypothetical protein